MTEELANQYVRQTKELAENLRKLGFRFALEHFGTGRDPLKLLDRHRDEFHQDRRLA